MRKKRGPERKLRGIVQQMGREEEQGWKPK